MTRYLRETDGHCRSLQQDSSVHCGRMLLERSIRFAGELPHGFWDDHARQRACRPDMAGGSQIRGLIQRAALHADRVGWADPFVPHARAASAAERAGKGATAVRRARPDLHLALRHMEVRALDDDRDAERGRGLFLAFAAVTHVQRDRLPADLIANRAALAASGEPVGLKIAGQDTPPSARRPVNPTRGTDCIVARRRANLRHPPGGRGDRIQAGSLSAWPLGRHDRCYPLSK